MVCYKNKSHSSDVVLVKNTFRPINPLKAVISNLIY